MPVRGYRKAIDCNQNCNDTEIFVDNFAQYYGTPQCYNPYILLRQDWLVEMVKET